MTARNEAHDFDVEIASTLDSSPTPRVAGFTRATMPSFAANDPTVLVPWTLLVITGAAWWFTARYRGKRPAAATTMPIPPPSPPDALTSPANQIEVLLERADCLLWSADVQIDGANWAWRFTVRRSGLYRRLFGDWSPSPETGLWRRLGIPQQREMDARSRDALERNLPGYEQEFQTSADGRVVWLNETVSIVKVGVKRWQLVGIVTDVTARHEAEEARRNTSRELAHLLGQADCLVWRADVERDGAGIRWHSFHMPESVLKRRLFGERSDSAGSKLWSLIEVPDLALMNARSRSTVLANEPGYTQEFAAMRDGRKFWLREQVSIFPAGPDAWQLVGVIVDLTAQREAEEARRASEARLIELMQRADCLLWQAAVTRKPDGELHWQLYLPDSSLYRRLFDAAPDDPPKLHWRKLGVPEIDAMRARAKNAVLSSAPGYEQEFRVPKAGGFVWLQEQVTITASGADEWRLIGLITDITARREADQARLASEARLLRILSASECMLWEANIVEGAEGNLDWTFFVPRSELYQRLFGSLGAPVNSLDWWRLEVPEISEMALRAAEAIRSGARGYVQQFRVVRPDGVIWLHEQVAIQPQGPGKWSLVGVIVDHTARRTAEEAVHGSELRYRSLLQHTPVAIIEANFTEVGSWITQRRAEGVTDLAAWFAARPRELLRAAGLVRILEVNEATLTLFRAANRSEFAQRLRRIMQPSTFVALREALLMLWNGGNTFSTEMELLDLTGRVRRVHLRWWIARDAQGIDLTQSVVALVDLTDLAETEAALAAEKERLAVTLRAMAEGVVTTDTTGRVQFLNPAAERMLQVSGAEGVGRSLAQLMNLRQADSRAAVVLPVASVAHGDIVSDFPPRTELVAPEGTTRLVEGCCAPVHAADSSVVGTVVVFRDVTERERLEQEVVRASKLESVGLLAGGIAHDFNNILTVVTGNLSLALLDVEPTSPLADSLREVERAALRARDLTQQLLTFAKGGEPVRSAVRLPEVMREIAVFSLHGSAVRAEFDFPPDLWPVHADKGQIGRVVQNLVINAVQAMPEGGVVRLSAHNLVLTGLGPSRLPHGDYVHIAISDTGSGIRPEHVARIFDPYFTTKQSGSGLGLAAVYSIVAKHQGVIDVESALGRGTTMHLWLPAVRDSVPAAPTATKTVGALLPGGRVLFMDDEAPIRQMAAALLRRLGFAAEFAIDGAEAVRKYEAALLAGRRFDIVIMDLTVPGGMGGREAMERLRALDPLVKAIVSSGYSSDPIMASFREHGFLGRVAKPYELAEFTRVLREVLER